MTKIALIGKQCSGKTTIANLIADICDADHRIIKFADPIYAVLDAMRVIKHRRFMQEFGDLAKKHFGQWVFVSLFRQRVRDFGDDSDTLVICDDVRIPIEWEACVELGFKTIYVHADPIVRKRRADKLGLEFIEDHNSEIHVEAIGKHADFTIYNNTEDRKNMEIQIAKILHVLGAIKGA